MANVIRGNKIYIDSTGSVTTQRVKIAYILFTPDAAHDELVLRETASDSDTFYLRQDTAKDTKMYDFSLAPLVFNNGLYIQTLTAGAKCVIITTSSGGQ